MSEKETLTLSVVKVGTSVKGDDVNSEITLNFVDTSIPDLNSIFGVVVPDYLYWKSISLDVSEKSYKMVFDEMDKKVVTLKGIKITKKENKQGIVNYTTSITISKEVDNYDQILRTTYLKRKEEDEKGKKKVCYYEVEFTKQ
jgi:hypothetical protein